MRWILLLLILPLAAAHPEDAEQFDLVPARLALSAQISPNSIQGIGLEVGSNDILPAGELVSVSARNYGPIWLTLDLYQGQDKVASWSLPPDGATYNNFHITDMSGAIFLDVVAGDGDRPSPFLFFIDHSYCPEVCPSKVAAHDVPNGVTVFPITWKAPTNIEIAEPVALPILETSIVDIAGKSTVGTATGITWEGEGPAFLLIQHGQPEYSIYQQAKQESLAAAQDTVRMSPTATPVEEASTGLPLLLVALCLAAIGRRSFLA